MSKGSSKDEEKTVEPKGWFNSLTGIVSYLPSLLDFRTGRLKQLDRQERIDIDLWANCEGCHKDLAIYFLRSRQLSRLYQRQTINAPYSQYYGSVSKYMDKTDQHYGEIEKVTTSKDPCKDLALLNDKLGKQIEEELKKDDDRKSPPVGGMSLMLTSNQSELV